MRLLVNTALFLMCLLQMPLAWAEQAYPIITYTCDKKDDVLKIKNEVKWGEAGKNFAFSVEKGTYNPWEWIKIDDRGGRQLSKQSKSVELSCELSGTVYRVVLEPKLFNPDFNGKCGDKLSVKVSIYMGKAILLEKKEMERFCRGNTKVIRGIKVYGKKRRVKVYEVPRHKFY
jgi:hypothetical protein